MKRILFILMLVPIISKAQIKTFDIPTPNAAELGRFGDIPVSYYTGKVDVNIPLYSLTVRNVTLPITLNYNASGVLVNSLPGWLGDNWALSAGGVITRIVQDVCDEFVSIQSDGDQTSEQERVYYEHDHYVNQNYFMSHDKLTEIADFAANASNQNLKNKVKNRTYDFSPDIFYFNFLGKTGRFFLGNDGEWKIFCEENLEVIFDYNNLSNYEYPLFEEFPESRIHPKQPKTIKGFIIRDANGTEYHFGWSKDYIEYSIPFFRQSSGEYGQYWTANSWYLRKIVDRIGNVLFQFQYQRGKFIAQLYNAASNWEYLYRYDAIGNHQYGGASPQSGQYNCPYDGVLNAPIYLTCITTLDNKRIELASSDLNKEMTDIYSSMYGRYNNISEWYQYFGAKVNANISPFPVGTYPFYYLQTDDSPASLYQHNPSSTAKRNNPLLATRLRKLDSITLYGQNGQNTAGTRYTFEYDTSSRIRLTGVNMKNGAGTSVGIYQLYYYSGLTEDYLSTATDHWGYYNANPITSYPTDVQGYNNFLTGRNANGSVAKAGMLSEIKYPTGGKTSFDFEANSYSSYLSATRDYMVNGSGIAGGVRIKSITNYDATGNALTTRKFSYSILGDTTTSSGQLFAQPRYYWGTWESQNVDSHSWCALSLFKSSSIIPLSNKFGPHVGYSCVKETLGDGSYKVYTYSNLDGSFDSPAAITFSNNTQTPYDVYTERDFKRGCLLSVSYFSSLGLLKQKIDNTYNTNNVESFYLWSSSLKYENFIFNPYQPYYEAYSHFTGGVYKIFYPKYDIVKETTKTYYESGVITDSVIYAKKDTTLNVTFGSYSHSVDVRVLKSRTLNRKDNTAMTILTYPFQLTGIATQLTSSQFFILPITTEEKLNSVSIKKKHTEFQNYNGKILPKYELEWKCGVVADTIVTYNGYTGTGNVSSFQEQGQPATVLNWTNNDCLLSKKIVGGNLVTDYTYTPFNQVSSITMPNGDITYYSYDTMGRLIQISDKNGHAKQKFSYNFINK